MHALCHVDIGVIGEGDESVPELVNAICSGRPLNEVRGIIFRSSGCEELIQTAYREEIRDLDVLPFPDYEGFEYGRYLAENDSGRGRSGERLTPVSIIGSRSCPYSCTFCFHPTGVKYRTRSLDGVFAEIEMLVRKYQINHVALREELFAADKERILDFCQRMSSYGDLHWSIQLRVNLVDEEIVSALSHAGCFAVFVGIESVDNEVLRSMNKMITCEQIEALVAVAAKHGLMLRSGLIFGDKAETITSAMKSLAWVRSHEGYSPTTGRPAMTADMLVPFPGSTIYKFACAAGIIRDRVDYLQKGCPIVNLTKMPDVDFLKMMSAVQKFNRRTYDFMSGGQVYKISPLT